MTSYRGTASLKKQMTSDTGWKVGDLQPRHCPILAKSKPHGPDWVWRSVRAQAENRDFWVVAMVNVRRQNYKAIMLAGGPGGAAVVARYEFHGSHPGFHIHSDCLTGVLEPGAEGMSRGQRMPPTGAKHRRIHTTRDAFWDAAVKMFRISGVQTQLGLI